MKKVFLPIAAVIVLGVFSCKDKTVTPPVVNVQSDYQLGLTNEDSTTIVQLGNQCMDFLKEGQIDQALNMLYVYDDSLRQLSPLTEEQRANYQRNFSLFPVKEYEISYFSFSEEGLNDLKYKVLFDSNLPGSSHTSYMFNPVKVDSVWYLSVKTSMQDIDEMMR